MVYGTYFGTVVGRLYLAVEEGRVVRLTGGTAEDQDVLVCCEGGIGWDCGRESDGGLPAGADEAAEKLCGMPEGTDVGVLARAVHEVLEYLDGRRRTFDVPVRMSGTPFQEKVWEALCGIPYGETRSYGEIAKLVGSPKGSRAVGMACGRNPVMILVPCHRVVGSNGRLVGFGGGLPMKEYLLALEGRI